MSIVPFGLIEGKVNTDGNIVPKADTKLPLPEDLSVKVMIGMATTNPKVLPFGLIEASVKNGVIVPQTATKLLETPFVKIMIGLERVNPKDGATMVWIPSGAFLMGSDSGEDNEKPQHTVELDNYWMYKYPVTVKQYRKFCNDPKTKSMMPPWPEWDPAWKKDDHPIVNVTWFDAGAYCQWAGVSLPTEAQWEKAARGTDGRIYPWGNEWDKDKCNTSESDKETEIFRM